MRSFKCFAFFFILLAMQFPAFSQEASIEQGLTHYTLYYPPYWEVDEGQIEGLHAKLSRESLPNKVDAYLNQKVGNTCQEYSVHNESLNTL